MPRTTSSPALGYDRTGPTPGPTLVFVGGMGSSRAAWQNQVRAFAGTLDVLTYDHRGTGESAVVDEPVTMTDYAADLVRLLDELGIAEAAFVGLSFGGRVCQCLALDWPERVAGLVLGGTSCAGPSEAVSRGTEAMRAPPLADPAAEQARWEELILPNLFGPRYRTQYPERMRSLARWRARYPTDAVGLARQWQAHQSFDVCGRLRFIQAPTLVLHGEDDALASVDSARQLAERIPGASLTLLDGVGHSPNVEDPTRFNGAILRFLAERLGWPVQAASAR